MQKVPDKISVLLESDWATVESCIYETAFWVYPIVLEQWPIVFSDI